MPHNSELSEADLAAIQARVNAATKGPWSAWIEGRDHTSGDSMISTGGLDESPDMYVTHENIPAPAADLDFIAHARQDVPRLVAELRRLVAERSE